MDISCSSHSCSFRADCGSWLSNRRIRWRIIQRDASGHSRSTGRHTEANSYSSWRSSRSANSREWIFGHSSCPRKLRLCPACRSRIPKSGHNSASTISQSRSADSRLDIRCRISWQRDEFLRSCDTCSDSEIPAETWHCIVISQWWIWSIRPEDASIDQCLSEKITEPRSVDFEYRK